MCFALCNNYNSCDIRRQKDGLLHANGEDVAVVSIVDNRGEQYGNGMGSTLSTLSVRHTVLTEIGLSPIRIRLAF